MVSCLVQDAEYFEAKKGRRDGNGGGRGGGGRGNGGGRNGGRRGGGGGWQGGGGRQRNELDEGDAEIVAALAAVRLEKDADELALMGQIEEPVVEGPTMMNREARKLMLAGEGSKGLALWKVRDRN